MLVKDKYECMLCHQLQVLTKRVQWCHESNDQKFKDSYPLNSTIHQLRRSAILMFYIRVVHLKLHTTHFSNHYDILHQSVPTPRLRSTGESLRLSQ